MWWFAFPIMLLPTAVFAGGLSLFMPRGARWSVSKGTWLLILSLAWATPTAVFMARRPEIGIWWPYHALSSGDGVHPPKFDYESKRRWLQILGRYGDPGYPGWTLARPEEAIGLITDLINDHPEYYNLYWHRAEFLRDQGRLAEAGADEQRAARIRASGGYYLPGDS
jgi:hypothetical protein